MLLKNFRFALANLQFFTKVTGCTEAKQLLLSLTLLISLLIKFCKNSLESLPFMSVSRVPLVYIYYISKLGNPLDTIPGLAYPTYKVRLAPTMVLTSPSRVNSARVVLVLVCTCLYCFYMIGSI